MLTSQDIKIIKEMLDASEERMTRILTKNIVGAVVGIMDQRFKIQTQQIKEYVDALHLSHEEWLRNHEKRITKLDNSPYYS